MEISGAHGTESGEGVSRGAAWVPLVALVVFGLVSVVGYAVFGRDPSRLGTLSAAGARFYAISFGFFAQGQVILAGLVLLVMLWRRARWRWVGAFAAVYGLSLGSELLGTSLGIPFGAYSYTSLLGPMWFGLVPVLIPLSWFYMAVPAYGLARRLSGGGRGGPGASLWGGGVVGRVLLGSFLLLAWDLSLDPAMSEVTRYWVWAEAGPYYGMPLMNLVGWYVTGLVLMGALEALSAWRWLSAVPTVWLAAYYGANLVVPVGMSLAAGLWGVAVVTAGVLGGVALTARLRRPPAPRVSAAAPGSRGAEAA